MRCEVNMQIRIQHGKHTLTIYLQGELDECTAEAARAKIDDATSQPGISGVIFDLSGLTFMDSTGIGVLIGRYKRLKARNIVLCVRDPSAAADKIFKMAGLYEIMPKDK